VCTAIARALGRRSTRRRTHTTRPAPTEASRSRRTRRARFHLPASRTWRAIDLEPQAHRRTRERLHARVRRGRDRSRFRRTCVRAAAGLACCGVAWMARSPELVKTTLKSSSSLLVRRLSAGRPRLAPTFSNAMPCMHLSAASDAPSITKMIAAVPIVRNTRFSNIGKISAPLPRAPSCTAQHGDHENDHAFDAPVGCHTTWRTGQPFRGCCGRHGRRRRRCEGRVHNIEAAQNRS
jgi:hypothetical protein